MAIAVSAVAATGVIGAPAARADIVPIEPSTELLVTYVARVCDAYTDVAADKARNNLMESLRDLGADTPYSGSGVVDADAEAAASPACAPLPGWRFTLGQGITGPRADTLNLSTVTGAYAGTVATEASTPLLDARGRPTGRDLEGATTVALTAAEADRVRRGQQLWVQGGTPADPLPNGGTEYGYAALRCAQDVLNGDNVERLSFPSGAQHVLCYAYVVTPPRSPAPSRW